MLSQVAPFPQEKGSKEKDTGKGSRRKEKLAVKKACDCCYEAKVKCDKAKPACSRCHRLGRNCGYTSRKRRTPSDEMPGKNKKRVAEPDSGGSLAANSVELPLKETFSCSSATWLSLENLLRKYATQDKGFIHWDLVCRFRALRQMLFYFQSGAMLSHLDTLSIHLFQSHLPLYQQRIQDRGCKDLNINYSMVKEPTFPGGNLKPPSALFRALMQQHAGELPFVRARLIISSPRSMHIDNIEVCFEAVTSPGFEAVFGYDSCTLTRKLGSSMTGFLPYGASVLNALDCPEYDLVGFLEAQCAKVTHHSGESNGELFELPSIHIVKLRPRGSEKLVKCSVRTITELLGAESGVYEQVFLQIEPLEFYDDQDNRLQQFMSLLS